MHLLRTEIACRAGARQTCFAHATCDPEIGEMRVPLLVEQDVGRLDAAMQHAVSMRVIQPVEQIAHQHGGPARVAEHVTARPFETEQQGHRMEQVAVGGVPDCADADDVRMRDSRTRLQQSFQTSEHVEVDPMEDLDGRDPSARKLRGRVDGGGAAGTDPLDQPVTGYPGGAGAVGVHGRSRRGLLEVAGRPGTPSTFQPAIRPASLRCAEPGAGKGFAVAMDGKVPIGVRPSMAVFQMKWLLSMIQPCSVPSLAPDPSPWCRPCRCALRPFRHRRGGAVWSQPGAVKGRKPRAVQGAPHRSRAARGSPRWCSRHPSSRCPRARAASGGCRRARKVRGTRVSRGRRQPAIR